MTDDDTPIDLSRVAVIIPALNEAKSLAELLPLLSEMSLGQILVCDNGSTDDTSAVARANGATAVYEPQRGYGAACWAGMQRLAPQIEVVVFLDADLSDDPTLLPKLAVPILKGESDFVLGARAAGLQEKGAMTFPQRFANRLFPLLLRIGWGYAYTDMGPFRAIGRTALDAIGMKDRAYGWTIEMQIRAVELGLRIKEIPVPYRKRVGGKSKVSGTIRGVILAAWWISYTCVSLWLTKGRRARGIADSQ